MGNGVRKFQVAIATIIFAVIVGSSNLQAADSSHININDRSKTGVTQAEVDSLRQRLYELEAEVMAMHSLLHADTALTSMYASLDEPSFPDFFDGDHVSAATEDAAPFHVESFFELVGARSGSDDDQRDFQLANAEVAVDREIGERLAIGIAVAYNSDDEVFELGAAELSAIIFEKEVGLVTSLSMTAGQFDVPFGIDYLEAAPTDRRLITAPISVENTHDYWNEVGAHLDLTGAYGNLTVFAVDGLSTSFEYTEPGQPADDIVTSEVNPAQVYGFRLGVAPFAAVEIGGSLATGLDESWSSEMTLSAVDLQVYWSALELRAEYIAHSYDVSTTSIENNGHYLQVGYDIDDIRLTSRYESFKAEGVERIDRYSVGAGYVLWDGIEGRIETQFQKNRDTYGFVQLIAAF